MENRYGFIRDKLEIKILILFVLSRLTEPVDFETLTDLCLCDDAISYFDYSDCVNELIATDHIYFDGQKYVITDKGRKNGSVTETGIPYTCLLYTSLYLPTLTCIDCKIFTQMEYFTSLDKL